MQFYSFGKDARLCNAKDFQAVFNQTLFKVHQPYFLVLASQRTQAPSRLGLVVAKKKVKRAHERNRIKRLARESFRISRQQYDLDTLDIVVMPKVGIEQINNAELMQQLRLVWLKLQKLKQKHQQGEFVPQPHIQSYRHKKAVK